ncbi:16S rRNA (adenine(1518)-N(6)/adenine(1519)-N(6))-dimethyltransferase RsmA [Methylonatrum kenyense]|uniref:16S rRNA (adenine(1518)-N(6)/adenine(1519)-N(6))- dimethyltransferase RsmA n=1 Tax=Methylonatrum kenyense TaxID=455253 RepID=UPI0020BFDC72|nr:16S rRNA (adenine(1518)-N(6)/adenine(1519)-N(6))-dimethyltransferase RsmA [Methylonatrum kenyense]
MNAGAKPPGHRARKRFGQNFLHDQRVVEQIVRAIGPQPDDQLLEIGPGQGALTLPLLRAAGRLHAIEMDRDLVAPLAAQAAQAAEFGELALRQGDALQADLGQFATEAASLRVVGNLPYNISSPLIFHLLEQRELIRDMHFMLQRELVDRMAAPPGSRIYGRLSVMVQYHCQVDRLFTVPPGAFRPAPKVESAVVRLLPLRPQPLRAVDEAVFSRIVATAFGQRRKMLRRSLAGLLDETDMRASGVDPSARPEQLGVAAFVALADALAAFMSPK